jgi:thioesterase domain-containing protein
MTDRPLYALSARGLQDQQALFHTMDEMTDTYYQHIKQTQPDGPYVIMGYSITRWGNRCVRGGQVPRGQR